MSSAEAWSNSPESQPAATGSPPTHPALSAVLGEGTLELTGRLLQASNATFLASLTTETQITECVYKPVDGERPLWDFPQHTLGLREVAAYEVSRIGGFDLVPATVLVDGPIGLGSLQVWVDADEEQTRGLVDLTPTTALPRSGWFDVIEGLDATEQSVSVIHCDHADLRLMAVFDCVINNADRKGGHILGSQGRVFGVDHGVSFHTENKLRTLLWGWAGCELTERERTALERVRDDAPAQLTTLLAASEIEMMVHRAESLLRHGALPQPRGGWPAIPWPPF